MPTDGEGHNVVRQLGRVSRPSTIVEFRVLPENQPLFSHCHL